MVKVEGAQGGGRSEGAGEGGKGGIEVVVADVEGVEVGEGSEG